MGVINGNQFTSQQNCITILKEGINMRDVGNITGKKSLKDYKKSKIRMLKKDFAFPLTSEETNHITNLESELAVDRYCRTLYRKYLFKGEQYI